MLNNIQNKQKINHNNHPNVKNSQITNSDLECTKIGKNIIKLK